MNEDILYIERFINGDQEGFEMLVRKYQNRALNIVYSLIGGDRESEDIVQEVFLKIYHNIGAFKQRSQFSTWLYRITVNTTYDFLRKRKNLVSEESAIQKVTNTSQGPKEALLIKEKEEMIQKALGKVPLKYRAAVVLKDIEGLSYLEIAKILHCRLGTVESRIYRARQFLKEQLRGFEGGLI